MRMPPLLADFIYHGACKPICEKSLTLPRTSLSLYDHQIKRSREKGWAAAADRVQKRNTTKGTLTDIKIRLGAFQLCFGACRKADSVWRSFRIFTYEF